MIIPCNTCKYHKRVTTGDVINGIWEEKEVCFILQHDLNPQHELNPNCNYLGCPNYTKKEEEKKL